MLPTSDLPAARRHILQALEEAPRYRAAHQRLLAIVERMKENEKSTADKAEVLAEENPKSEARNPKQIQNSKSE